MHIFTIEITGLNYVHYKITSIKAVFLRHGIFARSLIQQLIQFLISGFKLS